MWEEKNYAHSTWKRNRVHTVCVWGGSPPILISCILSWVKHNMRVGAAPGAELRPPTQCAPEADIPPLPTRQCHSSPRELVKYLELCRDTTEAMKSLHYVTTWPFSLKTQAIPKSYTPIYPHSSDPSTFRNWRMTPKSWSSVPWPGFVPFKRETHLQVQMKHSLSFGSTTSNRITRFDKVPLLFRTSL